MPEVAAVALFFLGDSLFVGEVSAAASVATLPFSAGSCSVVTATGGVSLSEAVVSADVSASAVGSAAAETLSAETHNRTKRKVIKMRE